jgi:hypothetical protein
MRARPVTISGLVVTLVAAGVVAAAGPSAAVDGPALEVDLAAGRHPISPDIYGMNFAGEDLAEALRLPLRRWGGNATTRYNYRLDETNRGSDWYFENVPGEADEAQLPDGSETDRFVEQDRRTGARTVLTVPLIGWIPKARDFSCGFSIAKYGPQQGSDAQWRPDCGNGVRPDGTNVVGNDPHDTSVEAGPGYVEDWIAHLTGKYGRAADGGVAFYNLDNEPDLWHATHRDVHPTGASYDEIRDSGFAIGAAVKRADPGAKTLGPVGWGWLSLSMSGLDQETCARVGGACWSNPPDRAAHGGVPFADWYLGQMRAYELEHGTRVLDYFDEHFYPQGSGVAFGNGNDPATNALRLRSTRALWDPSYTDESWINDEIALIPRMRDLVAANYPGTKLAITEYNYGALDHINGALTQADVLGIFGREGLDLATLWGGPSAGQPGAHAFGMYLNYDGQGGAFGDTGVRATSADQSRLSVYGAQRGTDNAATIMVVNKTSDDLTTSVRVANGGRPVGPAAQVWRYSAANPGGIVRAPDVAVLPPPPVVPPGPSVIPATFPANSITLLVAPAAAPDTQAPTAPGTPVASGITTTGFTVTWPPSTDNVGVVRYEVVATPGGDRVFTGSTSSTSFAFDNVGPGTYRVSVRAADAAGNLSPPSPVATVTTAPPAPSCTAAHRVVARWPNGFVAEVTVRNTGQARLGGWTVRWTYPATTRITRVRGGVLRSNAPQVVIGNTPDNGRPGPNQAVTFGLTATGGPGSPAPTCASP